MSPEPFNPHPMLRRGYLRTAVDWDDGLALVEKLLTEEDVALQEGVEVLESRKACDSQKRTKVIGAGQTDTLDAESSQMSPSVLTHQDRAQQ